MHNKIQPDQMAEGVALVREADAALIMQALAHAVANEFPLPELNVTSPMMMEYLGIVKILADVETLDQV